MSSSLDRGRLPALALFAVAMGLLEAAVVVYLRRIYYPGGFLFPLVAIEPQLLRVEMAREGCTLVMLATVGWLAGRNWRERAGWFLFAFGLWDLAYYLGLWLWLGWPPSLLTWDLLFLLPVVWVAPVLAPLLSAATLVALGLALVRAAARLQLALLALLGVGALMLIVCFVQQTPSAALPLGFVPERFNWPLFAAGEGLWLLALLGLIRHRG